MLGMMVSGKRVLLGCRGDKVDSAKVGGRGKREGSHISGLRLRIRRKIG